MKFTRLAVVISLCVLCGCSGANPKGKAENNTVVWWVDSNMHAETVLWSQTDSKFKDGEIIDNLYTKTINQTLKKKGFDYQVQFRYMDLESTKVESNASYVHAYLEKMKANEQVDVFMNIDGNFEDMAVLNEYLSNKKFKNFYDSLPKKFWDYQNVNNDIVFFPRVSVSTYQQSYIFNEKIAEESNVNIDNIHDFETLTQAMQTVYDHSGGKIIPYKYSDIQNQEFYSDRYKSLNIWDGHYVYAFEDNGKWKVVNSYETLEFEAFMKWNEDVNKRNLTGLGESLTSTDNEETFVNVVHTYPEEMNMNYYPGQKAKPITSLSFHRVGGAAIYKKSKHKEAAVELLSMIQTDKELSELFIYGIKDQDYEVKDGIAVVKNKSNYTPDKVSARSLFGNYLIITPSEAMGINGQKQILNIIDSTPTTKIDGFYANLTSKEKKVLNKAYGGENFIPYLETAGAVEKLHALNKKANEMGVNKIIQKIQKQLDAYLNQS